MSDETDAIIRDIQIRRKKQRNEIERKRERLEAFEFLLVAFGYFWLLWVGIL